MKNYTFLPELCDTIMLQCDTTVSQVYMTASFPKISSFAVLSHPTSEQLLEQ